MKEELNALKQDINQQLARAKKAIQDDTLYSAFNQVIVVDGHLVRPKAERTYPCFLILNDRLYRVSRDQCRD